MTSSNLCIALTTLLLLSACSYKVQKVPESEVGKIAGPLSFARIQSEVMPKCVRCHGWADRYEGAKAKLADIAARVQSKDPGFMMPKPGSPDLTQMERALLLEWIARGGPEFADQPANPDPPIPPVLPPPADFTFANVKAKVINLKCINCHKKELDTYAHTKPLLREIVFRLTTAMGTRDQMPPAAKPQLTASESELMLEWIRRGAPEGDPLPPPPPPALTFAEVKAKVFAVKCLSCHKKDLDTFAHTRPLLREIEFRVTKAMGTRDQMPPAKKPQLAASEKQMLLDWIHAGAPEK